MPSHSKSTSRKLAAILFADIAGYTAMMQSDEGKAMNKLRHYQTVLKSAIASHKGEIIKNYGDGSLCLFSSVLDAVHCAKALQETFRSEPVIPLRIGLHLGDVMYEENDIYGNDLNIASRIESMGIAGSVLLSKNVLDKVKNQADLTFTSLGTFEFKNVEEPMEVFALANEGFAVPKKNEIGGKLKTPSSKKSSHGIVVPLGILLLTFFVMYSIMNKTNEESIITEKSIAVLPFADMSPDRDQEYFADGIMEETLNHLVKIEGLEVTSRTSSMTYKGQDKKASQIASELGVASVLEGSVRKAGDALRVTVQFIDGTTDKHIWSETYDGNINEIFSIQSDIAQRVANQMRAQITPEVIKRIEQIPTDNMEAYVLYIEANRGSSTPEKNEMLKRAISLDPEFAEAYIALGRNYIYAVIFGRNALPENLDEYLREGDSLIDKGLSLDPNNAEAYIHKASMNVWFKWDFAKAEKLYQIARRLNPSSGYIAYTEFLVAMGDFDGALKNSTLTINANQNSATALLQHAMIYHFMGKNMKAEEILGFIKNDSWIKTEGNYFRLLVFQNKYNEMLSYYETLPRELLYPRAMGYAAISYYHTNQQAKVDTIITTLKQQSRESPIGSPAFHLALIYSQMGDKNEAFKWLEKAYQDREVEMYWLMVEPPFQPLHNDPRWKPLLYKVGFDVPVKG